MIEKVLTNGLYGPEKLPWKCICLQKIKYPLIFLMISKFSRMEKNKNFDTFPDE